VPKLLTVQEAADYLRVTDQTVIRYIKAGELGARKIRRQWRIDESALQRLTEGQMSQPPPDGGVVE
jgi:excisionase family DNA binding protein